MRTLTLIALISLILCSCTKEHLTGNDEITSEFRDVRNFTGVQSSGSNQIHISYGEDFKVEVRGSSNLIPAFRSRVRHNTLELGYEGYINVRGDDIEVFVTMPLLNNVALSGSGDVNISGNFPYLDFFRLSISGSGNAKVLDELECNSTAITISGSGDADLQKISAGHSDVTISGSGNVRTSAEESLKVRISGSGDVYYSGSLVIDSRISGSGKVKRM